MRIVHNGPANVVKSPINCKDSYQGVDVQDVRALQKEQLEVDKMDDGLAKDLEKRRLIGELYRASGEAKHAEVLKHIQAIHDSGQLLPRGWQPSQVQLVCTAWLTLTHSS